MTEQHNIWLCMGEHENRDILRTNHTIELKKKNKQRRTGIILSFSEKTNTTLILRTFYTRS